MIVAMPVTLDGRVGDGWGRAHTVAISEVAPTGEVMRWEEFEVKWDEAHDLSGEGQHHARIARFLMDHHVERVITGHMGEGMTHMLRRMNIHVVLGVHGVAREMAGQFGRAGSVG
jgi:predicted Fe-Mo cluster-binding NifX family protein